MIIKRYVIKKSMTNTKQPDVYTQMKITKIDIDEPANVV